MSGFVLIYFADHFTDSKFKKKYMYVLTNNDKSIEIKESLTLKKLSYTVWRLQKVSTYIIHSVVYFQLLILLYQQKHFEKSNNIVG